MSNSMNTPPPNKRLLMIVTAIVAVLAVGLISFSGWQKVRTAETGKRAEADSTNHAQIEAFLVNLLGRGAKVGEEGESKTIVTKVKLQPEDLSLAETIFREVLSQQRKQFGEESPEVVQTLNNIAAIQEQRDDLAGAEATRREALALVKQMFDENSSQVAEAIYSLADLLERRGDRSGAGTMLRDFWEKAVEAGPTEQLNYYRLIPLLVDLGDVEGYRKYCRAMLDEFGATEDPVKAERTARSCLLLPITGAELEVAARLASIPVGRAAPANKDMTYFEMVKGLAEYRMGRPTNALEWIDKCLAHGAVWGKQFDSSREVVAYAVQAMAHHQLKQVTEARESLAQAGEILQHSGPKRLSQARGTLWVDWATGHILVREAKALIEGTSAPGNRN